MFSGGFERKAENPLVGDKGQFIVQVEAHLPRITHGGSYGSQALWEAGTSGLSFGFIRGKNVTLALWIETQAVPPFWFIPFQNTAGEETSSVFRKLSKSQYIASTYVYVDAVMCYAYISIPTHIYNKNTAQGVGETQIHSVQL